MFFHKIKSILIALLLTIASCNTINTEQQKQSTINLDRQNEQSKENQQEQQQQIYLSFEDYKKTVNSDSIVSKSKSIFPNKKNNLDFNLKVGVLIQSPTNGDTELIDKEIKSSISLFLNDISEDKISIIPLYTDLNALSIKQSIAEGLSNDINVIISTLPAGFSKLASEEFYSKPTKLFISIPYIPISLEHLNIIAFGFNPNDQISTITQFAKYNAINSISILFPNNKFGGDLSLMLNKSMDEMKGLEIENAEFFTNSTKLQKVSVQSTYQEQNAVNKVSKPAIEEINNESFDEQRESGLDSEDNEIKSEIDNDKIKTNIPFYLNKILYYHNKKIKSINNFVSNLAETQQNPDQAQDLKKEDKIKWKTKAEAIADKKLLLFFTGSQEETNQFMKLIKLYKNKKQYSELFENLVIVTDSKLEEIINTNNGDNNKYYKDIFAPYQSFNTVSIFLEYFEKRLGFKPTNKTPLLLYDALSFANFLYSTQQSLDFSHTKMINKMSSKVLRGVLGEFSLNESTVKRKYSFIYLDKEGNLFKI